jgi:hypothetical protein
MITSVKGNVYYAMGFAQIGKRSYSLQKKTPCTLE